MNRRPWPPVPVTCWAILALTLIAAGVNAYLFPPL